MAFVSRTFDNVPEMLDYLNDIVLGAPLPARVYDLHGKTLVINDGGADRQTTFSDPSGGGLTPKEILDQIRAAHANMINVGLKNYSHMAPPQPQLSVNLVGYVVRGSGNANALLGLPIADTTVGTNAVIAADIVTISPVESNRYLVIHE